MKPVVYFIRFGERVKIGTSVDLTSRFSVLVREHGHGKLLGAVYGGEPVERAIHAQLDGFALGGEFFTDHAVVRQYLTDLFQVMRGAEGQEAFALTRPSDATAYNGLDEDFYVNQAISDALYLIDGVVSEGHAVAIALDLVSARTGIPKSHLWRLKYRPYRSVTAGLSAALRTAASDAQRRELDGPGALTDCGVRR